jgi:hypothetical protein
MARKLQPLELAAALSGHTANALVEVARYDRLTLDNDPDRKHDFGSFEFAGRTFFWKIDCLDPSMEFRSEARSDPDKTTRILTVMLAGGLLNLSPARPAGHLFMGAVLRPLGKRRRCEASVVGQSENDPA